MRDKDLYTENPGVKDQSYDLPFHVKSDLIRVGVHIVVVHSSGDPSCPTAPWMDGPIFPFWAIISVFFLLSIL